MCDAGRDVIVPFDEEKDYGPSIVCVEGHAPPHHRVMLSQLVRNRHKYVHEVFGYEGQWLKPYYDYESYWDSKWRKICGWNGMW